MTDMKSLLIFAVGLLCVHCQNTNPSSNPNARTLATGGSEFVVTGGGNQPSGGSGSLLDIALASFGTSSGGQPNPQPVDPNPPPPQSQPGGTGSGNFVDAVNTLLSTGTSQMDPNVLTNLGLPTEQNTNTQPMNSGFQSNSGQLPPNDPSITTGLAGGVPVRDPNSVPISGANVGPVSSGSGPDPNAIGGGLVLQVDPQSGMNRGPAIGDTAALQYSAAGRMIIPDPNTARNVVDPNVPVPSGSIFGLTGQPQPGLYPTMPNSGNTMQPFGGPGPNGPGPNVQGPNGPGPNGPGPNGPGPNGPGPIESGPITGSLGTGGPLSTVSGPAGPNNGGPLNMGSGSGSFGPTSALSGATRQNFLNGPASGGNQVLSPPPSGGILSSLKNNRLPGAGISGGPLAALKASNTHKSGPSQNNGMMEMLIMTMMMGGGGGEMNPALLAMAMGSMGNGGNGMSMMLPFLLMNGGA